MKQEILKSIYQTFASEGNKDGETLDFKILHGQLKN